MPNVTGTIQDITGVKMDPKDVELIFTLNAPQVGAAGSRAGYVYPTEPAVVKPNPSTGDFTVLLASTDLMLGDAWYTLQIRWQGGDAGATLIDYTDWRIRVGGSDKPLSELIDDGSFAGGGANPRIWWVGLSTPPSRSFLWLHTNPDNPDDPASTGDVREWR